MEKLAYITILYDLYSELLTAKQQQIWQMFYNDDMSLSEIASEMGISRQAVHDSNRRTEELLYDYENKLGLCTSLKQKQQLQELLDTALENENWQMVKEAQKLLMQTTTF